jgi:hypothetical protein
LDLKGIRVQGNDPVAPVKTFEHFGFDEIMMEAIKKEVLNTLQIE